MRPPASARPYAAISSSARATAWRFGQAVQAGEQDQVLAAEQHLVERGGLADQADRAAHRAAPRAGRRGRRPGSRPRRSGSGWRRCGRRCSCRRRSGRAGRARSRPRRSRSNPSRARVSPYRLRTPRATRGDCMASSTIFVRCTDKNGRSVAFVPYAVREGRIGCARPRRPTRRCALLWRHVLPRRRRARAAGRAAEGDGRRGGRRGDRAGRPRRPRRAVDAGARRAGSGSARCRSTPTSPAATT